jgi:hypothetical protein
MARGENMTIAQEKALLARFAKAAGAGEMSGCRSGWKSGGYSVCWPTIQGHARDLPVGLLTAKPSSPSYVNVINIHNLDFIRKIVRA